MNRIITPKKILLFYGYVDEYLPSRLIQELSAEEQNRAKELLLSSDRDRFIICRSYLRKILGYYLAVNSNTIDFDFGVNGKPALKPENSIKFNVSHSRQVFIIGLTLNNEIGVDIEKIDSDIDYSKTSKFIFSENALQIFQNSNSKNQKEVFINAWTRKEAILKALGEGLSFPPDLIEVSFLKSEKARLKSINGTEKSSSEWFLKSFNLESNYRGAIAVHGEVNSIEFINVKEVEGQFQNESQLIQFIQ